MLWCRLGCNEVPAFQLQNRSIRRRFTKGVRTIGGGDRHLPWSAGPQGSRPTCTLGTPIWSSDFFCFQTTLSDYAVHVERPLGEVHLTSYAVGFALTYLRLQVPGMIFTTGDPVWQLGTSVHMGVIALTSP